jgi:hypothetical protein
VKIIVQDLGYNNLENGVFMTAKELLRPFGLATLLGVIAVVATWAIATMLEVDFTVSNIGRAIPLEVFVTFSVVGGVGAWVVSALLLKTKSPRKLGQIIGWLVLIASIATPLSGTSDLAAIFWIQATHFAIGVPLLVAMFKHLPKSR